MQSPDSFRAAEERKRNEELTRTFGNYRGPVSSAPSPEEKIKWEATLKTSAGWFKTIAIFSVINTIIVTLQGRVNFLIGLGITQVIDGFTIGLSRTAFASNPGLLRLLTFAVNVGIALLFFMFGRFAQRNKRWAFILGMSLYALDGLIFIWVKDWLSLGFHAFALFMIYGGYQVGRKLAKIEPQPVATINADPPTPDWLK